MSNPKEQRSSRAWVCMSRRDPVANAAMRPPQDAHQQHKASESVTDKQTDKLASESTKWLLFILCLYDFVEGCIPPLAFWVVAVREARPLFRVIVRDDSGTKSNRQQATLAPFKGTRGANRGRPCCDRSMDGNTPSTMGGDEPICLRREAAVLCYPHFATHVGAFGDRVPTTPLPKWMTRKKKDR